MLATGPVSARPEPASLSPYSLAAYLERVAGPGAREVRVNGVYGSGHSGAWQFTAHLSWVDSRGTIRGGTSALPQLAGTTALDSDLDNRRLVLEHRIGWSLSDLDAALDRLGGVNDAVAMLELEIQPDGSGDIVSCHAAEAGTRARCRAVARNGDAGRTFADTLTDTPLADALSVQRARRAAGESS